MYSLYSSVVFGIYDVQFFTNSVSDALFFKKQKLRSRDIQWKIWYWGSKSQGLNHFLSTYRFLKKKWTWHHNFRSEIFMLFSIRVLSHNSFFPTVESCSREGSFHFLTWLTIYGHSRNWGYLLQNVDKPYIL